MASTRAARQQGIDDMREKKVSLLESGMMTVAEFAEACHVSPQTVWKWNCNGTAPRRFKLGRSVFYVRSEVEEWFEARLVEA